MKKSPNRSDRSTKPAASQAPSKKETDALVALYGQGDIPKAQALALSFTQRFPLDGFGWKVLGAVLQAQGQTTDAVLCMQEAAKLMPEDAETLSNLAAALQLVDRPSEARAHLAKALSINPTYAAGHFNLGSLARIDGDLLQAETSLRQAITLDPNYADAYINLGMTLQNQGRTTEAIQCYRSALRSKPDYAIAFSNLLFVLSHDLWTDPKQLFEEHLAFGERFETPLRANWQPHHNTKDPNRQLHIGFVSADLHGHAVASFIGPVLEQLSKDTSLVLHAYYNNTIDDTVSQRLRTYFAHWHPVAAMSDVDLAKAIRANGIDILIDLSGHTARNRLLTFARKPAPVQASWIGYPGTTGLQAMDYFLCDKFNVPPELAWQFSEKTAYLPISCPFAPSAVAPEVNALPALANGFITFGSFNRHDKINASTIALWCQLLRQIPSSKLLIGSTPYEQQEVLFKTFENNGIERARLAFTPRSDLLQYLTLHHHIDICLDAFPYNGGTTTTHAAWMGIPTLTLAGETMPTRSGSCIMSHLGLNQFIAQSIDDFVEKGCYWENHLADLAVLRLEIRDRFNASTFMQTNKFAASFSLTLRTMWQRWCEQQPPTALSVMDQDVEKTPSVLVFPATHPSGLAFIEAAKDYGQTIIAASSEWDAEVAEELGELTLLPYIYDDSFPIKLIEIVKKYNIRSIYAPVAAVYIWLDHFVHNNNFNIKLIGASPTKRETRYFDKFIGKANKLTKFIDQCANGTNDLSNLEVASVLKMANQIYGESNEVKISAMMAIFSTAPKGDVVEIGTLLGKSAAVLSFLAQRYEIGKVLAIDPWRWDVGIQHDSPETVSVHMEDCWDFEKLPLNFALNILPIGQGNLNYLRQESATAYKLFKHSTTVTSKEFGITEYYGNISVIHIDGNHDYEKVKLDCDLWLPLLVPGGWLILDDYFWIHGDGPRKVGDSLLKERINDVDRAFVCGKALFIKFAE